MKKSVFAVLAVLLLAALFVGGVSAEKVIAGVDDLAGAKIGVQIGTTGHTYATTYEGDEAGTTVTPYNKGADAVQALKTNKIDCVIIDNHPAESFVSKNPDLMILDNVLVDELGVEEYAICVKKDSPLTAEINEALAKLDAECFSVPWSKKLFLDDVSNKNSFYVLALHNNSVVAYGGLYKVLDEADITNIAVHPLYRRHGIAKQILDIIFKHCLDFGIKKLMLEVRCSNKNAIDLYLSLGFHVVGERKNYYSDNNETAILMTKYMEEVK